MRDPALVEVRLRAQKDRRLSDGAYRLLDLIISDRYLDRHWGVDDEFPLPWSLAARWTGICERQIYERLNRLERLGYLKAGELRGCPPIRHFFLVLKSAEKGRINSAEKGGIGSAEKRRINSAEKGGRLISNSLREEKQIKRARRGAVAPREGSSSLRSRKEAAPSPRYLTPEQLAAFREANRKALGR